jgi:hypothetical protein
MEFWAEMAEWLVEFINDDEDSDWDDEKLTELAGELEDLYDAAQEIVKSDRAALISYASDVMMLVEGIKEAMNQDNHRRIETLLQRLQKLVDYVGQHYDD